MLLSGCPFLSLSATVGNVDYFAEWLHKYCASQEKMGFHTIVAPDRFTELNFFTACPENLVPKLKSMRCL
jgi:superfamily II RNA helicase